MTSPLPPKNAIAYDICMFSDLIQVFTQEYLHLTYVVLANPYGDFQCHMGDLVSNRDN
jgi:hypothetical protein